MMWRNSELQICPNQMWSYLYRCIAKTHVKFFLSDLTFKEFYHLIHVFDDEAATVIKFNPGYCHFLLGLKICHCLVDRFDQKWGFVKVH